MGRIYGNNEWWGLRLLHKRSVQTSSCTQAPIDFVTFCLSRPRVRQPLLPPAPPFGTKAKEESFVAELVFPRANKRDEGVLTGKKKEEWMGRMEHHVEVLSSHILDSLTFSICVYGIWPWPSRPSATRVWVDCRRSRRRGTPRRLWPEARPNGSYA